MLTRKELDEFSNDSIVLYVPVWAREESPAEAIWLTFMWMVGQNWGWDKKYSFYMSDLRELLGLPQGISSDLICYGLNEKYSQWVRMGWINDQNCFFLFQQTDWEFHQMRIEDPRLQRCWIHLYCQVHTGWKRRDDLFETSAPGAKGIRRVNADTCWFTNEVLIRSQHHREARPARYAPHYIKGPTSRGRLTAWDGKIKQENDI